MAHPSQLWPNGFLNFHAAIFSVSDGPLEGRPKTANHEENVAAVKVAVDTDGLTTSEELEAIPGINAMSISRILKENLDEFQQAARAVTGSLLDPVVLDTIFVLFDVNEDGCLSSAEFIETIRARGAYRSSGANKACGPEEPRPTLFMAGGAAIVPVVLIVFKFDRDNIRSDNENPALRFAYWPRYVARLLRIKPVYRKELLGWRFETEYPFERPDKKPDEYREEVYLPVWRFSENPPWNIANRVSELPYPNLKWCVVQPDGKKVGMKLKFMPPEEQLIFKGDRVKVLVGPHKGKVGLVSSVLKVRGMIFVEDLNYRMVEATGGTLRREELPLKINSEAALIDPANNEPCVPLWRFTEEGERVRVSAQTGHILPLPLSARQLDDMTDPVTAVPGPKDTSEAVATKVTFDPSQAGSKISFEDDLAAQYGLETDQKRQPTYWY
ncbi:unnamed protein product [Calicophoron daubneyi]|uniref:Large ribosomal subunit protein uL24m n=1 Tax=Calicophoron daubneyi TaxID=300641 RepID=A0AAV2T6B5_CALDB